MADYSIYGDNLDVRGYVVQYGTFRSHVQGRYAGFRADNFGGQRYDGVFWDVNREYNFAIGLRNTAGTQVARAEFAPSERGAWKSFGNVATGQYAINARCVQPNPNYNFQSYKYGFVGVLRLGV